MSEAASHPVDIQQTLEAALKIADGRFAKQIAKNWDQLAKPDVQDRLAAAADIPYTPFTQWHLATALGDIRGNLLGYMNEVHTADDFAERCFDFIEENMEHLYFISNNPAEARIAQDYFETFLSAATSGLLASGHIDKEQEEALNLLRAYYDVGFDGYWRLREMVHEASGNQTSSLVSHALAQSVYADLSNARGLAHLPRLAFNDLEASKMLHQISYDSFNRLMAAQPIFQGMEEGQQFSYLAAWLYVNAMEIAADKMLLEMPETYAPEEVDRLGLETNRLAARIYNEALQKIADEGDVHGVLSVKEWFNSHRFALLDLPENFDMLLDGALDDAATESMADLPAACIEDKRRRAEQPEPKSARLGTMLWPGINDADIVRDRANPLTHYWCEELADSPSPKHLAIRADSLLDELAEGVFFQTLNPCLFLHAASFFSNLRRNLGGELHDAGKFRAEDFAALKRVEEKCLHYYESFYVTSKWMMAHTENAYDRIGLQEYMQYAADTGRLSHDMIDKEWVENITPRAKQQFSSMLDDMQVQQEARMHHPLLPLMAEKARTIAQLELGAPPEDEAEKSDYLDRVQTLAQERLSEALQRLQAVDPLTGEQFSLQPFNAEEVAGVMKTLDQRLQMLKHQGMAH